MSARVIHWRNNRGESGKIPFRWRSLSTSARKRKRGAEKKRVSRLSHSSIEPFDVSKNRSRSGKRGNNRCRIYTVQGAPSVLSTWALLVLTLLDRAWKRKEGKKSAASRGRPLNYNTKCQRVKRVWIVTISVERKKRLNISEPRAPRSLEFLRGQRQKLLFTLKFAAGREEGGESLVVDGITAYVFDTRWNVAFVRTWLGIGCATSI